MRIRPSILNQLINERVQGRNEKSAHRAALARNGHIICTGNNTFSLTSLSKHAEPNVLAKIGNARKYDLYVARTGQGEFGGNSRPCFHCLQAMASSGMIKHVVYTNGENYTISTVNKLLREEDQHISAGHRHFLSLDDEDDEDEAKPNLDM